MSTLITVGATGVILSQVNALFFKGQLAVGNSVMPVVYLPLPLIPLVEAGVASLDVTINSVSGHKIVLAHSLGADVATMWLREHGVSEPVPPADLEFVLVGNPERKYGGLAYRPELRPWPGWIAQLDAFLVDTKGLPESQPYQVTDFVRQYDFYADVPDVELGATDEASRLALANLAAGIVCHVDYLSVELDSPDNVVFSEGNVDYVWAPTYPIPLAGFSDNPVAASQDELQRPLIESVYDRPVSIPAPDYGGGDVGGSLAAIAALIEGLSPLAAVDAVNEAGYAVADASNNILDLGWVRAMFLGGHPLIAPRWAVFYPYTMGQSAGESVRWVLAGQV